MSTTSAIFLAFGVVFMMGTIYACDCPSAGWRQWGRSWAGALTFFWGAGLFIVAIVASP